MFGHPRGIIGRLGLRPVTVPPSCYGSSRGAPTFRSQVLHRRWPAIGSDGVNADQSASITFFSAPQIEHVPRSR
jgi:hypothetical protein